jgi:hypothetical protein
MCNSDKILTITGQKDGAVSNESNHISAVRVESGRLTKDRAGTWTASIESTIFKKAKFENI